MNKKEIKRLIRVQSKKIKNLEKQQGEIYDQLLDDLKYSPQYLEDDALWDYCFNSFGNLDDIVKEIKLN